MTPSSPRNDIEQPEHDAPALPPIGPDTPVPDREEPNPEVNQPLVEPGAPPERLQDPQSDSVEPAVGDKGELPPKRTDGQPDAFPAEQDLINDATLDRPV